MGLPLISRRIRYYSIHPRSFQDARLVLSRGLLLVCLHNLFLSFFLPSLTYFSLIYSHSQWHTPSPIHLLMNKTMQPGYTFRRL